MGNKRFYLRLIFLIPFITYCQREKLTLNSDFNENVGKVKEVLNNYALKYSDIADYSLIVYTKNDSTILFLGSFSNLKSVGNLEPFGLYKLNDKSFYIFLAQGVRWKKDPSFLINKPDLMLDDYPIWVISLTDKSFIIEEGGRGLFSPTLPPEDFNSDYVPPVIDSAMLH